MNDRDFPDQNGPVNPGAAGAGRCTAATAKGTRCRNRAKAGEDVCGAHAGAAGRPPIAPSSPFGGDQTLGSALCALVRLGMRRGPAARRIRISPSTVESWIERGEADLERGERSEFSEFVVDLEVARVAVETDCLETIRRAIKGDEDKPGSSADAWKMLERIRPDQWSPTHRVAHEVDVNIVEKHAEQLLEPIMGILADLGMADDPRVPDLIEKHFTPLERSESA